MTRAGTTVRWWSRGSDDPATTASNLVAAPGGLTLTVRGERRTLRVGPDVVSVRYDEGRGRAGRVALLRPDGSPAEVLDVAEWLPRFVAASGLCRGEQDDAVTWTGLRALADAAGLPLERGPVDHEVTLSTQARTAPPLRLAATLGLSGSGVVWIAAVALDGAVGTRPVWSAALVAMCLCAVVLFADQQVTRARSRRSPVGEAIGPRPSVAVTPRFVRESRLVVVRGAAGGVDSLVVRYPTRMQEHFDGPTSPLGLQRAVVVTPPGATRPERVDLVDGLGRQPVRLPWDQWFGGGEGGLAQLADWGLSVERATGSSLGAAASTLLAPRSTRFALDPYQMAGAFSVGAMTPLAFGASVPPIVYGNWLDSSLSVVVGIVNGVLLFGPTIVRLLGRQVSDRPRPPR